MARDPENIENEIEKTRDALAASLDALTDRANPKRFVDTGKQQVQAKLADPKIRYALIGVGAVLALAVLKKLFS
ncbi:DUF3618 domain-containing protein [Pseudonocardia pini]|uniref:DUF3618 domain-containing protein n=1 Tax=Pseudonocardia pini TaxID=2758030 RepID=UPI0015F03263|nr:DUF3618 domain-containing protein [Pseudonocardia pini]